jgi:hypothetical protein
MKCEECKYYFEKLDGNFECRLAKCLFKIKEEQRKGHKCEGCPWGTWTGLSYKCALPRCMPKLGSFNGVDNNGKTKKNS